MDESRGCAKFNKPGAELIDGMELMKRISQIDKDRW
jgi:hypothetical protein